MEVVGTSDGHPKERARIATKAIAKARTTAKAKEVDNLTKTKSATCAGVISNETAGHEQITNKMVNEVEVEDTNAEPGKEYVYTIEHEVDVVNLNQSGCGVNKIDERKTARDWDPRTHEGLVMIYSGASVNVCPKWFGNCVGQAIVQGDEGPVSEVAQGVQVHGVVVRHGEKQEKEEGEVEQEIK